MGEATKSNKKSGLRVEFVSWSTVKHFTLLLGIMIPVLATIWAWSSSAQAQTIEMNTTLHEHITQNCDQHNRYDKALEKVAQVIAANSKAIQKVTIYMDQYMQYEKVTDKKLDAMLQEQRKMLQSAQEALIRFGVEQRVLKDEVKKLNGSR